MTLDEFQTRLRAIYDVALERAADSRRQMMADLDALGRDAAAIPDNRAEALAAIVQTEVMRLADAMRALNEAR